MTPPEERPLDHDVFGWTPSKDMNVIDFNMIEHDVVRKPVPTFRHHALADLRRRIDEIDRDLVRLLARRLACVDEVVTVKRREGLPAYNSRVEEVIGHVRTLADDAGIPPAFTEHVWRAMIGWIIDYEQEGLSRPADTRF